jgi:hypothetical protein
MLSAMNTEPASKKGRSLTPEAFASFLLWLSTDLEQAAKKYLDIRRQLVKFFIRKGCAHSEELADRTLDRAPVIAHAEPGKYHDPIALCCGVARRIWFEYLREAAPASLENENIPAPAQFSNFTEREEKCLDSCLDELSQRDRNLITQYHQFQGSQKIETRKRLAQEFGGLNKLRIAAYRIRVRLHDCISDCVQRSASN